MSPTIEEDFLKFLTTKPTRYEIVKYIASIYETPSRISHVLRNALDILTQRLTDEKARFMLELLQNFDDNNYCSHRPEIRMKKIANKLYFMCNEVGMTPEDVLGICSIGDTTKRFKKGENGCTGEIGTGFKTAFAVAHKIEVYSGPADQMWRFSIEEKPRPEISYIVPQWIENADPVALEMLQCYETGTCLVLHLKFDALQIVKDQIRQFSLDTILFLRRINKIHFSDGDYMGEIERTTEKISETPNVNKYVLKCRHNFNNVTQTYLVIHHTFNMEPTKGRELSNSSLLSIAVLIGNPSPDAKLFAFLPTKAITDLPFHINADFILSASRESYQRDHPWNKQLEGHVVSLVAFAARSLANMPLSTRLVDPLQLVPIKSYAWMYDKIMLVLATENIVSVWNSEQHVTGSRCYFVPRALLELGELITPPNASYYIANPLPAMHFTRQMALLGVTDASKIMLESFVHVQFGVPHDSNWFKRVYICLATEFPTWNSKNTALFPFIQREDGQIVCPSSSVQIWPSSCGAQLANLRQYFPKGCFMDSNYLPTKQHYTLVCKWLDGWNIREVTLTTAVKITIEALRTQKLSPSELTQATTYLLECEKVQPRVLIPLATNLSCLRLTAAFTETQASLILQLVSAILFSSNRNKKLKKTPIIPYVTEKGFKWLSISQCVWPNKYLPAISTNKFVLSQSLLSLQSLRSSLISHGLATSYTQEECIRTLRELATSKISPEQIEDTLTVIYTQLTPDSKKNYVVPGRVWCGAQHGFQSTSAVLFNDRPMLAATFPADKLMLVWWPIGLSEQLAKRMGFNLLSIAVTTSVRFTEVEKIEPPQPVFNNYMRKALCCWHFLRFPAEWRVNEDAPYIIHSLLQIQEEKQVTSLESCLSINLRPNRIDSIEKVPHIVYLDTTPSPPVILRKKGEEEGAVFKELLSCIAIYLKLSRENTLDFIFYLSEMARLQQEDPRKYQERMEREFPAPPAICLSPSSSAFVAPVGEVKGLEREKIRAALSEIDKMLVSDVITARKKLRELITLL